MIKLSTKKRASVERKLAVIGKRLTDSQVDLPLPLKLWTAEAILRLTGRRKLFGLFVVLGWQSRWQRYSDIADRRQDIFAKGGHSIIDSGTKPSRRPHIAATMDFDGAILINRRGEIIHSGVMIEGLRPKLVASRLYPGQYRDLSERFGFRHKVHTRHLTAIAASYVFKGTTVFTVSEESGSFHVFEKGRIVYQSV